MAFTLYDASVANYLQILGALGGVLEKGAAHCRDNSVDLGDVIETRLAADMWPLTLQVISVVHHSRGAMEAARNGVFVPPTDKPGIDYAGLQALVAEARDELATLTPEAVNALVGRDVVFKLGDRSLPFKVEGFLMSFSLPNFYFHATTAYDILRHKGVPIGKRDFMGRLKLNM